VLAVLLCLAEAPTLLRVRPIGALVRGDLRLGWCLDAVIGLLAIAAVIGAVLIIAQRQSIGRILVLAAAAQLVLGAVGMIFASSISLPVLVAALLAVLLCIPAVSTKRELGGLPAAGYGPQPPYGAPFPAGQYPGQPPMAPQQYGAPQQYPPQQPVPGQPFPGQQFPPRPQPGPQPASGPWQQPPQPQPPQPQPGQWQQPPQQPGPPGR
jgi:hypothetical protein